MKRIFLWLAAWLIACPLVEVRSQTAPLAADTPVSSAPAETALQSYVDKVDESFRWEQIRSGNSQNVKYVELILQSQTWRGIPWKHQLWIVKPSKVTSKQAVLLISGGRWDDVLEDPAHKADLPGTVRVLAELAKKLEAPIAVLNHVPQQPMFDGMVEDAIISYTFEKFITSGQPDWPLLLPMVKSAVRAMDAVQDFAKRYWLLPIDSFTVTGASKRGWTTWLVAAQDERVNSIAPMVIDMLNMSEQMEHQVEAWGDFSDEIHDYTSRGLQDVLRTQKGRELATIVDPFAYREKLKIPKIIINGTNDRYWPVDALNLYWKDLPGIKYPLYVPNAGHGLGSFERVLGAVATLHQHASGKKQLPKFTWDFEQTDEAINLEIVSDTKPDVVRVWQAEVERRDFRDAHWSATELDGSGNKFRYTVDEPRQGSVAILGELVFLDWPYPLYLSTRVEVVSAEDVELGQ